MQAAPLSHPRPSRPGSSVCRSSMKCVPLVAALGLAAHGGVLGFVAPRPAAVVAPRRVQTTARAATTMVRMPWSPKESPRANELVKLESSAANSGDFSKAAEKGFGKWSPPTPPPRQRRHHHSAAVCRHPRRRCMADQRPGSPDAAAAITS